MSDQMISSDQFNDKWGNIDKTLDHFSDLHKDEEIIYYSAGCLMKRKGDSAFKGWTSFRNRRGNLVITEKRCFFSNPVFSGHSMIIPMAALLLFTVLIDVFVVFASTKILFGSMTGAVICQILFAPLFILVLAGMVMNIVQRLPFEMDLEHGKMKRRFMGTYNSITKPCPMFSVYDGEYSYHLVGYRQIDEKIKKRMERIFS